jgi:hypothetical protein
VKRLAALLIAVLAPAFAAAQYNSYTSYAPGTAPSYEGLWWDAAESGWGLSIAHQGDVLFAVWYTFDRDGTPTWFLMPEARLSDMDDMVSTMGDVEMMMGMGRQAPSYTGALYRPGMSAGKLVMTQVGVGTVLFNGRDRAVFAYSVGNFAGSKDVSRMVYDAAAPSCTIGGAKGAHENYHDLWFDPQDAGWGVNIVHQGSTLFGTYYTYDAAGRPIWYAMPETRQTAAAAGNAASYYGPMVRATGSSYDAPWDAAKAAIAVVGEATFTFNSRRQGALSTRLDGAARPSRPLQAFQFAAPASVCN